MNHRRLERHLPDSNSAPVQDGVNRFASVSGLDDDDGGREALPGLGVEAAAGL
jgi:hypothetical protein